MFYENSIWVLFFASKGLILLRLVRDVKCNRISEATSGH